MKAPHKLMSQLKMQKLRNLFGKEFGSLKYQVRSNILCRNLVLMLCLRKTNLQYRKIQSDPTYHLYSKVPKIILHALWGCEKVQPVWEIDFAWLDKDKASSSSFTVLVELVCENPLSQPYFLSHLRLNRITKTKVVYWKILCLGFKLRALQRITFIASRVSKCSNQEGKVQSERMVSSSDGIHKNKL